MRKPFLILGLSLTAAASAAFGQTPDPIVRFSTSLGDIDVQLSPADAPNNVANFLSYVDAGSYNNSFIHRLVASFVFQGGGYYFAKGQVSPITAKAAVNGEFKLSNVRGTIAMALSANASGVTDPNTATDQWFFNLVDNGGSPNDLDSANGPFTVIGHIVNSDGFGVMDAIGALMTTDAGSPFDQLPVVDYTGGSISMSNLVEVMSITRLASHPGFFDGEVSLGNAVNYLAFPNGNPFGYYSYLSDPNYVYHYDLGFEYVFDANDSQHGVYFYDFASRTFFYTSPTFPFPYLYDFSLNTFLYYYPDTSSAGHYTSNPRYFYDFATQQIITK